MKTIFISGWAHGTGPMKALADALGQHNADIYSPADLDGNDATACPDYAAGICARLDTLHGRTVLGGWSTGGIVALEAAIRRPEKVYGLILISVTPRFCAAHDFPCGVPVRELIAMNAGLHRDCEKVVTEFLHRAAYPQHLSTRQKEEGLREARRQGGCLLGRGLEYLRRIDCRKGLKHLDCPCLIFHGEKDKIIPYRASCWMEEQIKNCECLIRPDAGHFVIKTHLEELRDAAKPFLENC